MKVLILGGQGMLGHKVFQTLSRRLETYASFRHINDCWNNSVIYSNFSHTINGVDVRHFDTVVSLLAKVQPDIVINCIGVIKQLEVGKDPVLSLELNALFPHRLAQLCQAARARLIHFSTDCVFSGNKGRYSESDRPDPVDLYGRTKLLGELNQPGCLTLRTSVIGRDLTKRVGLLEWFISNRNGRVKGFTRAIYTGLTTQALSEILYRVIVKLPELEGLYHVASQPISKYDLLWKINNQMNLNIEIVSEDNFTCDRSLLATRFMEKTGLVLPSWDEMVSELVVDPTPYDDWHKTI
jgi:dTDP-4-dehydrorhamnose reductase